MTNGNGGHPGVWRVVRLAVALILAAVAWWLLAMLAAHARVAGGGGAAGLTIGDWNTGKEWATGLLGLAATIAGFFGIAGATQRSGVSAEDRTSSAFRGMIGVLGGTTLLGVGGWPVPIALAAMAGGAATDRVLRSLRAKGD